MAEARADRKNSVKRNDWGIASCYHKHVKVPGTFTALTAVMAVGAFSNSGDLSIENVLSQELKNRGSIPCFLFPYIAVKAIV